MDYFINDRCYMNRRILPLLILASTVLISSCSDSCKADYRALIEQGEFTSAQAAITHMLTDDGALSPRKRLELEFEIERLERIRKDFRQTRAEVVEYIRGVLPEVTDTDMERWEQSRALEWRVIDGRKLYFNRTGRNLFRIDPEAKAAWQAAHPDTGLTSGSGARKALDKHNLKVIEAAMVTGQRHVKPVRLRIKQAVVVDADAVPAGEVIRCWLPYPREIAQRQVDIALQSSEPDRHVIAPNDDYLQRTIYFEKNVLAGQPTRFEALYEYTSYGSYAAVTAENVEPLRPSTHLESYLAERPPHIVFTPQIRELSEEIVGDETNPYLIARKIFGWIDANRPWASAREYSTIANISMYCLNEGHGDCGIKALLAMTLFRLNGIPTRWQSGWEFQPPNDSMHDWARAYFEPFGWVPLDVTYGLRDSENEQLKWFYVSGMDSYRLIFNDGYSQQFYPAKVHHRSETVDSQRGEVEWRGGNLYFDQWDWEFEWEIIG